jgi:4-amino-4-deoxy-L-arabinose transferase-like glycosyltransferase
MLGPTAAFLGAIVLATTVEFVALSRTIVHDIALELCVAVALFALFRAHAVERRRTAFLVLAYLATGLAGLAKGPVGILIPGSVFFFYLLARRDLVSIRYMMVLRGALLVLLVAAPWYILLALRDPDYLRYFLIDKNIGSFVSEESTHPNPFYFYLPILILGFFPWSCFLPLTLARLLGRLRRLDPARLFLLIWSAFVLLFFSVASSKLPTYILPLFPPVALLIGDLWGDFLERSEPRLRRWMVVSQLCLIAIMAWAVPVFVLQGTRHPMYDAELHAPHLYALVSILAGTVLAGSVFLWRRNDRALFAVNASLIGLIIFYGMTLLLPAIDAYRTSKYVALALDARLRPGLPLVFYPDLRESALFYTDRRGVELKTTAELEEYLREPGAICVLDPGRLDGVTHLTDRYRVVERWANKIVVEAVAPPPYMRE